MLTVPMSRRLKRCIDETAAQLGITPEALVLAFAVNAALGVRPQHLVTSSIPRSI